MFLLTPGGRHDEWQAVPGELVALDVDGTLIGLSGTVSDAVVAAIARSRGAGLHMGLATGRMALGVTEILDRTGLPGPHVLHNGAEVLRDGEVVASWPVQRPALAQVLHDCNEAGIYLELYVQGGYLVNRMEERARPHWELLGSPPLGVVTDIDEIEGVVPKVTAAVFDPAGIERAVAVIGDAGLRAGPANSPATPSLHYVNGNDLEVDKGRALRAAAEAVDVDPAAVVAVGDERNDIPLLEAAGTAIAMGNASREVRAVAHLIAPDVEQHGVAAALDAVTSRWRGVSGAG